MEPIQDTPELRRRFREAMGSEHDYIADRSIAGFLDSGPISDAEWLRALDELPPEYKFEKLIIDSLTNTPKRSDALRLAVMQATIMWHEQVKGGAA